MEQVCDLWLDETHDLHTQNKISRKNVDHHGWSIYIYCALPAVTTVAL